MTNEAGVMTFIYFSIFNSCERSVYPHWLDTMTIISTALYGGLTLEACSFETLL